MNRTYELAPWADVLYSGDVRFWADYDPKFAGLQVCGECRCGGREFVDVRAWLPATSELHLSGSQALVYAASWGCSKIILTGFDLQGGHWHADHNSPNLPASSFDQKIEGLRNLAPDLKEFGVRVINATPAGALNCFERMDLQDALSD